MANRRHHHAGVVEQQVERTTVGDQLTREDLDGGEVGEVEVADLEVASAMLTEMPDAQISLNELARRVGLAKSNVLRYFETREAVLIHLLNKELDSWVDQLSEAHLTATGSAFERADAVASWLSTSLAARPVLCDLISSQASVLERNVSTELVVEHKQAVGRTAGRLQALVRDDLPELSAEDAYVVISHALLMTSAV